MQLTAGQRELSTSLQPCWGTFTCWTLLHCNGNCSIQSKALHLPREYIVALLELLASFSCLEAPTMLSRAKIIPRIGVVCLFTALRSHPWRYNSHIIRVKTPNRTTSIYLHTWRRKSLQKLVQKVGISVVWISLFHLEYIIITQCTFASWQMICSPWST